MIGTFSLTAHSQNYVLDQKNGFKDIKLGTDVNSYSYMRTCSNQDRYVTFQKQFMGEDIYYHRYEVSGSPSHYVNLQAAGYSNIVLGANKVKNIFIYTHNGLIYLIAVILDNDVIYRLEQDLITLFGKQSSSMTSDYYTSEISRYHSESWEGENVALTLSSIHGANRRRVGFSLRYMDKELLDEVYELIDAENEREDEEKRNKLLDEY